MKILVTGGCGFIGTNLVDALLEHGHEVRILDHRTRPAQERLTSIHGDIRDREKCRRAVEGMEAVVHLAASTSVSASLDDPSRCINTNVNGTLELLAAAQLHAVRRFVNISTGGAYYGNAGTPTPEHFPPRPLSPYGAAKVAAEALCMAYSATFALPCVTLRLSNVYGPHSGHKPSLISAAMMGILAGKPLRVYGDGRQVRDYVYVGDVVAAILKALDGTNCGPINIGSGIGTDLNQLLDLIEAAAGQPLNRVYYPGRAGEVHTSILECTLARLTLQWWPRMTLPEGLWRTWRWCEEQVAETA